MQINKDINSWIFSLKEDLWILCIISILSGILLWPNLFFISNNFVSYIHVGLLFQLAHLMSVHFVTYGHKNELASNKVILILLPIITLALVSFIYKFQFEYLYLCFSILGMIHFIRQQYGVLMTTMRKGRRLTKNEAIIHQFLFYNFCLTPVIYFIASSDFTYSWWGINFDNYLNEYSSVFLSLIVGGFLLIIMFEIKEFVKFQVFNFSKILHLTLTLILWFIIPYFSKSWFIIIPILVVQHSIYSLYFCYKRFMSWDNPSQLKQKLRQKWYGPLITYFVNLALCLLIFSFTEVDRFLIARTYNTTRELSDFTVIIGITIVWNHYWLDALIWRKGFRKKSYSFLEAE
jgi:hypothetical protein